MATWQDGPEYAPLAPPTGYDPAVAPPFATARDAGPEPALSPAEVSATGPTPPAFEAPEAAVPLAGLVPVRAATRDPHAPFPAVARVRRAASPWRSVHASPQAEPEPEPPVPIPTFPPFREAQGTGFPDLDRQVRTSRWLLLPAVLFVVGALAGPWVTATVLAGSALLGSLSGIHPGARTLSRIVAGLLGSLLLLFALVGRDWIFLAGMSRFVGLVYSLVLATWYLRRRAELEAERRRRTTIDGLLR